MTEYAVKGGERDESVGVAVDCKVVLMGQVVVLHKGALAAQVVVCHNGGGHVIRPT